MISGIVWAAVKTITEYAVRISNILNVDIAIWSKNIPTAFNEAKGKALAASAADIAASLDRADPVGKDEMANHITTGSYRNIAALRTESSRASVVLRIYRVII